MTTARIDARFAALKAAGRAGFVTYVMAGDPTPDAALEILRGLPAAGADLIELGIPFSDPMAEGPPIQKAAIRALKAGLTLKGTLDLARAFRDGDADTPLILMGYLNPLESYGYDAFARDAAASGVDGVIVVDCPPEEADPLSDACRWRSASACARRNGRPRSPASPTRWWSARRWSTRSPRPWRPERPRRSGCWPGSGPCPMRSGLHA